MYVYTQLCVVFALHLVLYIRPFGLFKKQPNPHFCTPPSFPFFKYATIALLLIYLKDIIASFMGYEELEPVALSMSQGEDALSKCVCIGLFVDALTGF